MTEHGGMAGDEQRRRQDDKLLKNKRARQFLMISTAIVFMAWVAAMALYIRTPSLNIDRIDELGRLSGNDRLMVFAPHCDDEVLGPGGLIGRAVDKGIPVKVVLLTNGDNNIFSTDIEYKTIYPSAKQFIEAGETRQQETIRALARLGVHKEDIIFLGFPDRGIKALYTRRWFSKKPYKSRGTRDTRAPYKLIYEPQVVYSGENLLRNIGEVADAFSPTIVASPLLADSHPDHKYGAKFILKALENLYGEEAPEKRPLLLGYLVHYYYFPIPRGYHPGENLLPPISFTFHFQLFKLTLSQKEEARKHGAINQYKSQLRVMELRNLMKSFVRRNELFEIMEYPVEK